MPRLIDADALYRKVKAECNPYGKPSIGWEDGQRMMEWIEHAPTVAKDIKVPNKWVSVKDRLPKDGIFVLVCNDDGHMMLAKWESEAVRWEYKYMNYDWDVWDEEEQGPICYWMPLPKPPKEDNNEGN